jgi:hypothetical protein
MPSRETPRGWVRLDVDFFDQDTIQDLGHQFGPAGPLLLQAIIIAAKKAKFGGVSPEREGVVSLRYRPLAHTAFIQDADEARRIVAALVRLGLLEPIEDEANNDERFTARLTKWKAWEPPAPKTEAERKAEQRARKKEEAEEKKWNMPDPE